MNKKNNKTKVFMDIFKGYEVFAIWSVNENDEKIGEYPVMSFGKLKARAILNHLQEIQEYAHDKTIDKALMKLLVN